MVKRAKDIMRKRFKVVRATDTLQTACKVLIRNKISGVPVVNRSGILVGFISEKDVIKSLSHSRPAKKKVADIMSKRTISVDENSSLDLISKIFSEKQYRHIPVTVSGKIIGIVNRADIMDNLLGEHY